MRYFTLVKTSDTQVCLEYASFKVSARQLIIAEIVYTPEDLSFIKNAFEFTTRAMAVEYLRGVMPSKVKVFMGLLTYSRLSGHYVKNGQIRRKLKCHDVEFFQFYQLVHSLTEQARLALSQRLLNI